MQTTDKEIELLEQVKEEATKLRDNITEEERNKLNYNTLEGYDPFNCVYGQITGSCHSRRAVSLIESCAKRVYVQDGPSGEAIYIDYNKLNGSPKDVSRKDYFSPIEVLLYDNKRTRFSNAETSADNKEYIKKLVDFLKKDSDILNF